MSKWRIAGLMLSASIFGATTSMGAVYAYWKTQTPPPLRPMVLPITVRTSADHSQVIDVPAQQYAYLGRYVFNTETLDAKGEIVWATKWVHYDPNRRYKFVAPVGLEPGSFSVMMNIDYAYNPISRAEGTVKFLDLIIEKEEENESHTGTD